MRRSSKKFSKDPNQLAHEIVRLSTQDPEEAEKEQHEEVQERAREAIKAYLSLIGRKGGLKGGPARAEKLSKKERIKIAKDAAKARWEKGKTKKE